MQRLMEDMVMKFANRLALTMEEQRVFLIDDKDSALLHADKVILVRRVLSCKAFKKERFKHQMLNMWCPKARVTIMEMDDGLFSFGFDSVQERLIMQKKGHGYTMVLYWCWQRWKT